MGPGQKLPANSIGYYWFISVLLSWFLIIFSGMLIIPFIPVIAVIQFISSMVFYLRGKASLQYPLTFELSSYDLSVIGTRIYRDISLNVFFGELLRLNEKKAVELKYADSTLIIKPNKSYSGLLSKYQKIILENLPMGVEIALNKWAEVLEKDKEASKPLDIKAKIKEATTKSIGYFLKALFLGFFVILFSFNLSMMLISFYLLLFINSGKNSRFPRNSMEYNALPKEEKDVYEKRLGIISFLLFISIYVLLWFSLLFISPWVIPLWFVFTVIVLDIISVSYNSDEGNFFARLVKSMESYSDLGKQDDVSYFLMYGGFGAWALALKLQNPEIDEKIEKTVKSAKIVLA
jgi:hypothetical protein